MTTQANTVPSMIGSFAPNATTTISPSGTNRQHEGALQQGFLGVAEVAGIVGFGCTGLPTGLRVRSDRIVAMGVRVVRMKFRANDREPQARRTSPPG